MTKDTNIFLSHIEDLIASVKSSLWGKGGLPGLKGICRHPTRLSSPCWFSARQLAGLTASDDPSRGTWAGGGGRWRNSSLILKPGGLALSQAASDHGTAHLSLQKRPCQDPGRGCKVPEPRESRSSKLLASPSLSHVCWWKVSLLPFHPPECSLALSLPLAPWEPAFPWHTLLMTQHWCFDF